MADRKYDVRNAKVSIKKAILLADTLRERIAKIETENEENDDLYAGCLLMEGVVSAIIATLKNAEMYIDFAEDKIVPYREGEK